MDWVLMVTMKVDRNTQSLVCDFDHPRKLHMGGCEYFDAGYKAFAALAETMKAFKGVYSHLTFTLTRNGSQVFECKQDGTEYVVNGARVYGVVFQNWTEATDHPYSNFADAMSYAAENLYFYKGFPAFKGFNFAIVHNPLHRNIITGSAFLSD